MKKFAILLLLSSLIACEDFLDEQPQGLPVADEFYDNLNELQLGVDAIYQVLRLSTFQLPYAYIGSGAGDNLVTVLGQENAAPTAISTLNATSQDINLEDFWASNYLGIQRANVVIENARSIDLSSVYAYGDGADRIFREQVGEAKFLRAFFYFNLVRTFGGVPIKETVLTIDGSEDNFAQPRSTVEEVYELIEKDLREAIIALNERWISVGDIANLGKIGSGQAWCLLLKVLVYQAQPGVSSEKWEQARAVGQHIVNRTQAELPIDEILNFESLYDSDTSELNRIIYQDLLLFVESYDEFLSVRTAGLGSNDFYLNFQYAFLNREEADFSEETVFEVSHTIDPSGTFALTSPFHANLSESNLFQPVGIFVDLVRSDPRGKIANIETGTTLPDGNVVANPPFPDKSANYKWYTLSNERTGQKNFRIMRYAEVIYYYAEALNETGDQFGAVEQLNRIKARARLIPDAGDPRVVATTTPVDFVVGNYLDVRTEIYKDRRIELCYEFDRFWELVRTGEAEAAYEVYNIAVSIENKKNFRLGISEIFPIPLSEIDASNGLVIQNPGY